MPVYFHPHKPIEILERFIVKEDGTPLHGEIAVYRKLFQDLEQSEKVWHVWHDLKLPFHSDNVNRYRKTSAQIDFLILCEEGIIILEVKGGAISFRNNTFYYGNNYETEIGQDPFSQAEGYKYTIKDRILRSSTKYLLCHGVAFPHCNTVFNVVPIDSTILWSPATCSRHNNQIDEFILSVFRHNRNKHKKYHRNFPRLSANDVEQVTKILSPIANDLNRYYHPDTSEWLNISNLDILESLEKNERIMIQGCPGTGKTTLAKAFIDQQITKKGLYLCWNNLLMHKVKRELASRELMSCEVNTFSRFILELDPSIKANDLIGMNVDDFYELVKRIVESKKATHMLPSYDYVVLDEGQDVLDRGADIVINEIVSPNGKGLTSGRILLLYDIDQSYDLEGRDVFEITDLVSIYFAHFRLNEIRRSAQCPEIREVATRAIKEPESFSSTLFNNDSNSNVRINYFDSLEEVKNYLVKNVLKAIRDKNNSLKGNDCIALIESPLLRPEYNNGPGMHYYLQISDVEELTETNIGDESNKLRYTSILKFKGLEKENVFLIVQNPSHLTKYELYVGVTRAISNLEILSLRGI